MENDDHAETTLTETLRPSCPCCGCENYAELAASVGELECGGCGKTYQFQRVLVVRWDTKILKS